MHGLFSGWICGWWNRNPFHLGEPHMLHQSHQLRQEKGWNYSLTYYRWQWNTRDSWWMNCLHCKSYAVLCAFFVYSVNYKILHDDASQKIFFFSFFFMAIYFGTQFIRATKGHTKLSVLSSLCGLSEWTSWTKVRVATVREKPEKNKDFSRSGKSQGTSEKILDVC